MQNNNENKSVLKPVNPMIETIKNVVGIVEETKEKKEPPKPKSLKETFTCRKIQVGKLKLEALYSSFDVPKRNAYKLRQSTLTMVEEFANLTGIEKKDVVDLVLNLTLQEYLKKAKEEEKGA